MLIYSLIFLLLSNAVTLRRDKAILYSRLGIIILIYCSVLSMNVLYVDCIEKGIGLFGGLYHVTPLTQIFHTFIFLLTGVILNITAFYPRKI
jgi:NADH-ubiquinone oxidoreductase chain 2